MVVVIGEEAEPARAQALRDSGAETLIASGSTDADRVRSALSELGRRKITSLFLEGGRTLAAAFTAAGAIDEARVFVAPILLGNPVSRAGGVAGGPAPEEALATAGGGGSPATTGPARQAGLATDVERVGEDVLITTRFREW